MSRVIKLFYNVNTDQLVDGTTGATLRPGDFPWVFYKEKPLVNLQLVDDGDLTAHTLFVDSTYASAVDLDFDAFTGALMCLSADSDINKADEWLEVPATPATADPALGQFSIQLDANTVGFKDKIDTTDKKQVEIELMSFNVGGDITGVLRMPIIARNLVNGEVSETIAALAPHLTEEIIDGQLSLVLRNSDGVVLATFEPQ